MNALPSLANQYSVAPDAQADAGKSILAQASEPAAVCGMKAHAVQMTHG
jgi:hypothetical protein